LKKIRFGILITLAILALVSVAAASNGEVVKVNIDHVYGPSYWSIHVLTGDPTAPQILKAGDYKGWCSDYWGRIYDDTTYYPRAYSSLITGPGEWPIGSPAASTNWRKINYILNANVADYRVRQAAIWHYDGDSADAYPSYGEISGYDHTAYDNLITATEANGNSYVVGIGNDYAIVLWDSDHKWQEIFVQTKRDSSTYTPEFPSLALPVGLLIGMVGLVYTIKTRKED
jgi:hypothetical protein